MTALSGSQYKPPALPEVTDSVIADRQSTERYTEKYH